MLSEPLVSAQPEQHSCRMRQVRVQCVSRAVCGSVANEDAGGKPRVFMEWPRPRERYRRVLMRKVGGEHLDRQWRRSLRKSGRSAQEVGSWCEGAAVATRRGTRSGRRRDKQLVLLSPIHPSHFVSDVKKPGHHQWIPGEAVAQFGI